MVKLIGIAMLFAQFTTVTVSGAWTPMQDNSTYYTVNNKHCGSVYKAVTPTHEADGKDHTYWYGYTYKISGAKAGIRVKNDDLAVVQAAVVADCPVTPDDVASN